MSIYRRVALFVVVSILFITGLRLMRIVRSRRAQRSLAVAMAQISSATRSQNGESVVLAPSPIADYLAGANDYLWIEEGMVRGMKSVSIPVDPWVTRVLFSATGMTRKCQLTVISPAAAKGAVPPSAPALHSFELPMGVLLVIDHPAAGLWTLQARAKDDVTIVARAVSSIGLDSFQLSNLNALFKAGQGLHARARLRAPELSQAVFRWIAKDGTRLPPPPVSSSTGSGAEYDLSFSAPASPFRLLVLATNRDGIFFQRVSETLFEPEPS
jgi:hypothetical protein